MTDERKELLRKAESNARQVLAAPDTMTINEELLAEAVIGLVAEIANSVEVGPELRRLGPWAVSGGSTP